MVGSLFRQRSIPRSSRTRSPEAPDRGRQFPQHQERKALVTAGIPGYPRSGRKRHDRPVTPEVAGSSPVAPVKVPANRRILLSAQTPDRGQLHTLSTESTRNGQKTAETPFGSHDFKPILAEGRSAAKAACDYTNWPEVKVPPTSADSAYASSADLPLRARVTKNTLRTPP